MRVTVFLLVPSDHPMSGFLVKAELAYWKGPQSRSWWKYNPTVTLKKLLFMISSELYFPQVCVTVLESPVSLKLRDHGVAKPIGYYPTISNDPSWCWEQWAFYIS